MLKVLYYDNHIIAAEKPAGIPTQPSKEHKIAFECTCKEWVKKQFHKKGNVFLQPIHRLDRNVSGIVLFARTSKALSRLQALMRKREIRRIYLARVEGKLTPKKGTLEHFLRHGSHKAYITTYADNQSKKAILSYEVLAYFPHKLCSKFGHSVISDESNVFEGKVCKPFRENTLCSDEVTNVQSCPEICEKSRREYEKGFSFVKVELHTGRYHQIRAQLSYLGHPIAGDEKYESTKTALSKGIDLHHAIMELIHPVTKEKMVFKSSPSWFNLHFS